MSPRKLLVDLVWFAEKFTQYYSIVTFASYESLNLKRSISPFRFDDAWVICQQANSVEYWKMLAGEASSHLDIEFGIVYENVLIAFST